jgi:membrane protein YdbS with pleckstrin-like domain
MIQEIRPSSGLLKKNLTKLWIIGGLGILAFAVVGIDWYLSTWWMPINWFKFVPFFFAIGAAVIFLILTLIIRRNFKHLFYVLSEETITVHRSGVFSQSERVVSYDRITDVMLSRGFFDNRFGIATVTIMGRSGDLRGIRLDGLEDAKSIYDFIRQRMTNEPVK